VAWLYVARLVSGLTLGGVSFVIPIYVAEIVEPSVRGPLSAVFQVRANILSFVHVRCSGSQPFFFFVRVPYVSLQICTSIVVGV
jgi:MFS family permease